MALPHLLGCFNPGPVRHTLNLLCRGRTLLRKLQTSATPFPAQAGRGPRACLGGRHHALGLSPGCPDVPREAGRVSLALTWIWVGRHLAEVTVRHKSHTTSAGLPAPCCLTSLGMSSLRTPCTLPGHV